MLDKEDIIKFYMLYERLNPLSNNIGVFGTKDRFFKLITTIQKEYKKNKNAKIIINQLRNKITILEDDKETCYIHITHCNQLCGLFFRKYI